MLSQPLAALSDLRGDVMHDVHAAVPMRERGVMVWPATSIFITFGS